MNTKTWSYLRFGSVIQHDIKTITFFLLSIILYDGIYQSLTLPVLSVFASTKRQSIFLLYGMIVEYSWYAKQGESLSSKLQMTFVFKGIGRLRKIF